MTLGIGTPTDWTNGTGIFPAGGVITIPANAERQWLFVENRDLGEVTVQYTVQYASGGTGLSAPIPLDPASAAGKQGGKEDRNAQEFFPAQGAVTVSGTSGQRVTILTYP